MSTNQQVLTITNLNKTFKSNHVLKDLSCTLEQGKIYGLIGKNGVGKTTLIKCIIGALLDKFITVSFFLLKLKLLKFKTRQ